MQIVRYLPLIVSGWQVLTCVISYTVAVKNKHVYYMLPYISDTGAMTPESNIFGQCLNIGAALMAIGLYVRFRQVDYDIKTKNINLNPLWNKIGLALGFLASLGVSIVGNFSELSVLSVHIIGALMAFGIGIVYFYVQTWISSYYLKSRYRRITRLIFYARLLLAVLMLPVFLSIFVFAHFGLQQFQGKSWMWWTEEYGGFYYRVASAFAEWLVYFFVFIYIATFSGEFKHIELTSITFKFKQPKD